MVSSIDVPAAPSPLSDIAYSPFSLDPRTRALLDEFLLNKAEEERKLEQLEAEYTLAHISDGDPTTGTALEKPMMSVDEYHRTFREDWQLSQFWYSTSFATRLADIIDELVPSPDASVGFICSPTAFVAFQKQHPRSNTRLLEVDKRFTVLAPSQYIPYNLNEPDKFPPELRQSFDLAVVDPPFLNEDTNEKLVRTLKQILKPSAKLILITSVSVEDVIKKLYNCPPLGPMRMTTLEVEHGQLANDFACWGSWEGAESLGSA